MPVGIDDPLIARMRVRRVLPVHESCRRLRALSPQYPRVYGVAVLADVNPYRWWPVDSQRTTDLLPVMFEKAARDLGRSAAARQLAASLAHEVIGRMLPLVLMECRAWDVGLENLWMHIDKDSAIDWVAIVDPTLRVLPDDPCLAALGDTGEGRGVPREAVVVLPSEMALTTWVAHRCHRSLTPLFAALYAVSDGAVPVAAMWRTVASAIVGIAAQVPEVGDGAVARRSQAILDAMAGFGLPVRRTRRSDLVSRRGECSR